MFLSAETIPARLAPTSEVRRHRICLKGRTTGCCIHASSIHNIWQLETSTNNDRPNPTSEAKPVYQLERKKQNQNPGQAKWAKRRKALNFMIWNPLRTPKADGPPTLVSSEKASGRSPTISARR